MAFGNLTVDFKQLARVPVRDRAALARSAQASEIFGNLTPSQIASLFPDYYKKFIPQSGGGGGSMAAGLTGAGTTSTGTSTSTATTTGTSTTSTTPTRPGFIQDIIGGIAPVTSESVANIASSSKFEGSHSKKASYLTARLMKDLGLTKEQAAGFVGNLSHESAGLKVDIEEYAANVHGTRGYGLAQWTDNPPGKGRRTNLINFAKERNIPINDFETQYQFLLYELNGSESKALARIKSAQTLEEAAAAGVYFERPQGFTKQAWKTSDMVSIAKRVHGWDSRLSWSKKSLQAFQDAETSMQITQGELQTATAPITGQAPQGSDAQIQNLLGTPADQSTAVVAAPRGPAKTMILSLGTNDFSDPKNTYQNTIDAINEGRKKGYNVVVVPPVGNSNKFKAAYDEVMRAVNETGAPVEQPQEYSADGYHPTAGEYKRIGEKYQGAVVVGDSIAVGIGQYTQNGQTVATEGIRTDAILSKIRSDQITQLDTAQISTATAAFDTSVFAQLDPRIKEWHDKAAGPDRALLEAAITQRGVESINQIMAKYPKSTATAVDTSLNTPGPVENVEYGNMGKRSNVVDPALKAKISAMINDIYGPEYKAVIYSGGEPTSGQKVSQSGRHDVKFDENGNIIGGQAADIYITHRETGQVVPRAQQIKAAQYWQYKGFGGVGLGMKGGGIHLDQVQRGEARGENLSYRAWAYGEGDASQRFLTEQERTAMIQARSEGFDISSITIPQQQTAQTQPAPAQPLPGTEAQTQPVRPDDTAQIPLQQSTANTAPAMKLGGEMNFKEPNTVKESMSLMSNGKEVAQFNKNEQVNVEDGKIKVQNEYDKRTKEAQRRNDKGNPTNQYSMRQTTTPETPRTFPDQVKYGIVSQSPSAKRQFETAQFGGYDHFSRRTHS